MVRMRSAIGTFGKLALSVLLAIALFPYVALAGALDVEANAGEQAAAMAEESAGDDETIPCQSDPEGSRPSLEEPKPSEAASEEEEASAIEQQGTVAELMEEGALVAQGGEGVLASSGYDADGNLIADSSGNKWELTDSRTLTFYSLQTTAFSTISFGKWVTEVKTLSPGAITVILSEGITTLPNSTLLGLSGTTYPINLVVPSTLTTVGATVVGTLSATNCLVLNTLVSHGSLCCEDGVLYTNSAHTNIVTSVQRDGAVVIPSSVTTIPKYAFFAGASGFTTLTINTNSLKSPLATIVSKDCFVFLSDPSISYNGHWESISAVEHPNKGQARGFWVEEDENSPYYGSFVYAISATNIQPLFTVPLPWVIEDGVRYNEMKTTALGMESGFADTSIILADTCTSIAASAFQNATTLTSISGIAVTDIGPQAFRGCTALASASFPVAKSIGEYAFADCGKLASIDIDNAESIAQYAFSGCALDSFVVPATVSLIGNNAFSSTVLKTLDMSQCKSITTLSPIGACSALTNLVLPPALQVLNANAFKNCTALKSVDLSSAGIKTLPAGTFNGCTSLETVVFPSTLTGIEESGSNPAFGGCTSLKSVDLSSLSMTSIPYGLFQGCSSLENIGWPKGIQSIGQYAFQNTGLKDITIPEGVALINTGAFMGCGSLIHVGLPNTLKTIGTFAFADCTKLIGITVPLGVTDIKAAAFSNTAMTSFVVPGQLYAGISYDAPTWSGDSDGTWGGGQIFTGTVAAQLGKDTNENSHVDYWSNVTSVDLSQYQQNYLPPYFFMGLNKMAECTLPHNISILNTGVFFGCEALKDLYIYNQNIRIAGAGTTGDSSLGWTSLTMPSISHWKYTGTGDSYTDREGWEVVPIEGIKLHGLAYASNDLIAYAEKTNCTFVPFVVLDGYDTKSAFGYDVYGYNEVQGVPESLEFTGEDLMGQIAPKVRFTDPGVPDSYDIDLTADKSRLTYQVCDASGNVVSSVVDPGTYTVKVAGVAGSRDVFGTKTLTVNVAYTPSSVQVTGDVASAGAALVMDAATGDALVALGSPATAAGLKAALDAATHVVDVSHVSSGTAYDEVVASVGSGTLGMTFVVSYYINDMQVHDGFGRLTVTVGVPEAARGHWVTLHHRHQDGGITTQNLKCTGSTLSFTVTDLSTFALEIGALIDPPVAQGATTTVYRTVYQPGAAAPLAATGPELAAPDNAVQAKGAAPDIAYGGNAKGGGEAQLDWLPPLTAGLLVLLAVGAVTWFLLARKRSKDEEQGQAVA